MKLASTLILQVVLLLDALSIIILIQQAVPERTFAVEPCSTPSPSPSPTPTPQLSPNPSPTPTPDLSLIFLTEFMACPESGSEWIELFNAADEPIDITNWQIIDAVGNKKFISGSIAANSYAVFEWSGSLLNNSSDSFTLYTPDGQEAGSGSYISCSTGISFVYENGEWVPAIDSPGDDTTLSQNTLFSSTAAASLRLPFHSSQSFGIDQTISSPSAQIALSLNQEYPFTLPQLPLLTQPETLTAFETSGKQEQKSPLPAISVIIGGLLHILPGSYLLYDNYLKHYI